MNRSELHLYLVADPDHVTGDLVQAVQNALLGGVTMVQLRAKSLSDREHLDLAFELKDICLQQGVSFIVNDRLDIALACDASGIHLGVDDLPIAAVRRLTPANFIVGYSPETDEQITSALSAGVDYLGVGPVFGTTTKTDAGAALGIDEFSRRCAISPVPVVGIGGIGRGNASRVIEAGAAGVAVASAILGAPDARAAARDLVHP